MTDMRMFPIIQDDEIKTVPFDMMDKHDGQARINHGGWGVQALAARGGLTPEEACAILENRAYQEMTKTGAMLALKQHVEQWLAKEGKSEIAPFTRKLMDRLEVLPESPPCAHHARPTHLFILTKSAETRRRLENIRDGRLMLSRGHMNEAITLLEELEHIVRGET